MALIQIIRESPPKIGRCTGATCGRSIEWVTTTAGQRMPVDHPLVVESVHERPEQPPLVIIDGARSHFVTCPDASRFRRRKQ